MLVSLTSPLLLHGKRDPEMWLASTGEPSTGTREEGIGSGASGAPVYAVRGYDGATDLERKGSDVDFYESYWTRHRRIGSATTCRRAQSANLIVHYSASCVLNAGLGQELSSEIPLPCKCAQASDNVRNPWRILSR